MSIGFLPGARPRRLMLLFAGAFAGAMLAASCGGGGGDVTGPPDPPPPPPPPAVGSVDLDPSAVNLAINQTSQLTATVRDAAGAALTGRTIAWATADAAVATVAASGMVTAVAPGEVQVTATSEGKVGTAVVTVSDESVATVQVTPDPATVAVGQTGQLVAVARSAGGSDLPGRPMTWTTADAAVATVNESGVVSGIAVGEVIVTATSEGKSGTARVTVSAVLVATVAVTPATTSISEGATVELTATAKDANGNTLAGRAPTWSTGNATVASVGAAGKVTGLSAGTATITATIEGKTGTSSITVTRATVASVTVAPTDPTVTAGQRVQLIATVKDGQGGVLQGRPVTWTTSAEAVAGVGPNGRVSGIVPGTVTITATSEGVSGSTTVTVTAAAGIVRTWKGGASGKATDWSAAANWNPSGVPIPLDTARVPATASSPVLKADVEIARLILSGGRLRTAGFRLKISGR